MQISHFRNKRHLRSRKIVLLVTLFCIGYSGFGQFREIFNPNYDNRQFSYGFLIGVHNSAYQIRYSEKYTTNALDSLHSIQPTKSPGFSLGFLVNYRLEEFFDLRLTPKVAFYEYYLEYYFTDQPLIGKLKESTVIEFPVLIKYKSNRRGNSRMFVNAGLKPGIEATGKNDIENSIETLNIQRFNISAELGAGFDIYFPLFKLSPEIRLSKGFSNVLSSKPSIYSEGLSRLNTNVIHFYLIFQ